MDGDGGFHPNVRKDFPGGWKEDKVNAFLPEGRTGDQADAYDFLKKLLNWRKDQPVIHQGKLTHYIPEDNIYVYFRHSDSQSIMVLMNGNASEKELDTKRFAENVKTHTGATNVLTGEKLADIGRIKLPAQTAVILELK
jgi:glycosidase